MSQLNRPAPSVPAPRTHEGAIAHRIKPIQELRRTVLACMLWEDTFYESGQSVANRIKELVPLCNPLDVQQLAIDARGKFKLRHVPLLLTRELARHGNNVAGLLEQIIQRPDELSEFLAIYWSERPASVQGKPDVKKLAKSVKRGLASAFTKFNAYSLAKYNRDSAIKLRDVMFLVHPKPRDEAQAEVFKQLASNTLPVPDTWEVALSSGADKKETWERLIGEGKLGALALLRNLRNMEQAGVSAGVMKAAMIACNPERVLPFRFITAARYAPTLEPELETLMFRCLKDRPKLKGKTILLLDGSGSMFGTKISGKSELDRFDAAVALAMLVREVCEEVEIVVFSNNAHLVPPRRGFALHDICIQAAEQGGTYTEFAKQAVDKRGYNRIIILTDEQSHQTITNPLPGTKGYVINVATNRNGIGYGAWTHIDGWSEAVIDFIQAAENEND